MGWRIAPLMRQLTTQKRGYWSQYDAFAACQTAITSLIKDQKKEVFDAFAAKRAAKIQARKERDAAKKAAMVAARAAARKGKGKGKGGPALPIANH